jgi:glycosyltransferase involved in cell wall biosynthesis
MSKTKPQVSVVIPTHLRPSEAQELVATLREQRGVSLEIIIVANPHEQVLANLPHVRYFSTSPPGANRARNRGLAEANGEIVFFIDDDCLLQDRNLLQKHYALHEKNTHVTGFAGSYELHGRGSWWGRVYHRLQNRWLTGGAIPGPETELFVGGHVSFKKSKLSGLTFDDQMAYGATETELNVRLALRGDKVEFHEQLKVSHRLELSAFEFYRRAYFQGRGNGYLKRRGLVVGGFLRKNFTPLEFSLAERSAEALYRFVFQLGQRAGESSSGQSGRGLSRIALGLAGGQVRFAGELVVARIWYFLESMLFLKKR